MTWKFNDEVLEDRELYHFEKYEDTHCLEVKDVEKEDAGPYTCVAVNSEGEATCQIPLVVQGMYTCIKQQVKYHSSSKVGTTVLLSTLRVTCQIPWSFKVGTPVLLLTLRVTCQVWLVVQGMNTYIVLNTELFFKKKKEGVRLMRQVALWAVNYGIYNCIAVKTEGKVTNQIMLVVHGVYT